MPGKKAVYIVVFSFILLMLIVVGIIMTSVVIESPHPPYGPAVTVQKTNGQYLITLHGGDLDEVEYIGIARGTDFMQHEQIPIALNPGATYSIPVDEVGDRVILVARFKDESYQVVYDKNFLMNSPASSPVVTSPSTILSPVQTTLPSSQSTTSPTYTVTTLPTQIPASVDKTINIRVFIRGGKMYVQNLGGSGASVLEGLTVFAGGGGGLYDKYDLGTEPQSSVEILRPFCGDNMVLVTAEYTDGSSEDVYRYLVSFECNATG